MLLESRQILKYETDYWNFFYFDMFQVMNLYLCIFISISHRWLLYAYSFFVAFEPKKAKALLHQYRFDWFYGKSKVHVAYVPITHCLSLQVVDLHTLGLFPQPKLSDHEPLKQINSILIHILVKLVLEEQTIVLETINIQ